MTFHVSKRVIAILGAVLLVAAGAALGAYVLAGDGDDEDPQSSPGATTSSTTSETEGDGVATETPDPDGRYQIDCDYLLGDGLDSYSFVASGTLRNTGNTGIVTDVEVTWNQIGTDPVVHSETIEIAEGRAEDLQVEIPVTGDQVDRIQATSGKYCDSKVKIVDTFKGSHGSSASATTEGTGFIDYTSATGGWTAEVPDGLGWGSPVETEPTPGQLFRTEFPGPDGATLVIDATPFEPPTFNAASQSRETISHPGFASAEKVVFQGSENIASCAVGTCVDFLLSNGAGGFAVLAGGPENFAELEALAERVALSLRPSDG